jgi:hypothetical protein
MLQYLTVAVTLRGSELIGGPVPGVGSEVLYMAACAFSAPSWYPHGVARLFPGHGRSEGGVQGRRRMEVEMEMTNTPPNLEAKLERRIYMEMGSRLRVRV